MLDTLHDMLDSNRSLPVFGLNLGTVGFLMNRYYGYGDISVPYRQGKTAHRFALADESGDTRRANASVPAPSMKSACCEKRGRQRRWKSPSMDRVRIPQLAGDGVLLATPVGSTAYNLSANGPILPLDSRMLALTPISPFRPRRWPGAILPERSSVTFRVHEPAKRPVAVVADQKEVRDVAEVHVEIARDKEMTLLFDPGHALDERIVAEQFIT